MDNHEDRVVETDTSQDEVATESNTEETTETKAVLEDSTHVSESEDEGRKGTIARIAEILRGTSSKKAAPKEDISEEVTEENEVSATPSETEVEEGEEEVVTDEYEEIDPRFVAAARGYGWSDDRIRGYAESHDDRDLVTMTGMMEKTIPSETQDDIVVEKPSEYQGALDQIETNENVDGPVKQLLKSLVADLQNTKAQLTKVSTASEGAAKDEKQQEWLLRLSAADEQFDIAAKEFTELGSAKTLRRLPDGSLNSNDPAVKIREDLFKIAVALFQSGSTWNTAVKDSLRWYKGGREDVVEAQVLQKIKNNSKRLTPKREQRHQVKKYANALEEKAAVVNQALAKHGIELPQ